MSRHKRETNYAFPGFTSDDGFTRVPDTLFDTLLPHLGEAELKALLYIIRRTVGFNKACDAIALSQFLGGIVTHAGKVLDSGCGVRDRSTLIAALRSLETMGVIESEKPAGKRGVAATTLYRLCVRPALADPDPPPSCVPETHTPPPAPVRYPQGGDASSLAVRALGGNPLPPTVGNSHVQNTEVQKTGGNPSKIREALPFFCVVSRKNGDDENQIHQVAIFATFPLSEQSQKDSQPPQNLQQLPPPPPAAVAVQPVIPMLSPNTAVLVHANNSPARQKDGVIPEKTALIHRLPAETPLAASQTRGPLWVNTPELPLPSAPDSVTTLIAPADCAAETQQSLPGSPPKPRTRKPPTPLRPNEGAVRVMLDNYIADFTGLFRDNASHLSSVSRAVNIFYRADVSLNDFVLYLFQARTITQHRTSAIRTKAADGQKVKMSYFFAVLENLLDGRTPPIPERAPDAGPYTGALANEWGKIPFDRRPPPPPHR